MTKARYRILITIAAGAVVTGCSQSSFKDTMGLGKYSPDETQVRTNQTLAMPPSLQLAPPRSGSVAAADGQEPKNLFAPQPVTAAPPVYGAPDSNETPPVQAVGQQPSEPQTFASTAPQPVIQQQPAAPDVYEKWGISKFHPDGRPKTETELTGELRKQQIARQRQKNPNYGTIFNMPNVWNEAE